MKKYSVQNQRGSSSNLFDAGVLYLWSDLKNDPDNLYLINNREQYRKQFEKQRSYIAGGQWNPLELPQNNVFLSN